MASKVVILTGSRTFQDIGTIGQTVEQLAGNIQSVNEILDVGLRNTKNFIDSFLRVSDVVGLGFATLNGNKLIAGTFGTVSAVNVHDSISGDGSSGAPLQLVNDTAAPGNSFYYGTNGSGTKGWYALPAGGSLTVTDGTNTVTGVTQLTFSGATVSGSTPNATVTISGGGGSLFNITPDSHPSVPTGVGLGPNDEFETGSTIDTAGTRYAGATAWTALNILAAATSIAQGSIVFTSDSSSNSNPAWNMYMQPVSGSTFTYTAKFAAVNVGPGAAAIFFRNSANGHLLNMGVFNAPPELFVSRCVSPTSTSTVQLSTGGVIPNVSQVTGSSINPSIFIYLQIVYDGTNLKYLISPTGVPGSFTQVYTETAAAFLGGAPTHVGFGAETLTIGIPSVIVLDWFRQTA